MSLSWIFFTFFLFPSIPISRIEGLKCYVCSDGGEVSCKDFDIAKDTFIQECISTDKGCFMKIEGSRRTRSCDSNQLDDCQEANGAEYCFCSSDLCNDEANRIVDTSDDEDFVEGSGTRILSISSTTEVSVKIMKSCSDESKLSGYISLMAIYAMMII